MASEWKEIDSALHAEVISGIIGQGFAPSSSELAKRLKKSLMETWASLERLDDNHGLVLHPGSHEVWVAHPFSLSPTSTWVQGSERGWWAPCLWCAFGIATLIDEPCAIHSRIAGERAEAVFHVKDRLLSGGTPWVHFPKPPRQAWENVHHFCASLLPFKEKADAGKWCERHAAPMGQVLPAQQLYELATVWYGSHRKTDWVKWSAREAQEIFQRVGLQGKFWELESNNGRF